MIELDSVDDEDVENSVLDWVEDLMEEYFREEEVESEEEDSSHRQSSVVTTLTKITKFNIFCFYVSLLYSTQHIVYRIYIDIFAYP